MKIEYTLNVDDLIAFYERSLKNDSVLFKNYIFLFALFIAVFLELYNNSIDMNDLKNGDISLIKTFTFLAGVFLTFVFLVFIIFIIRFGIIRNFKKMVDKNSTLTGKRELELVDDTISLNTNNSNIKLNLIAVKKVENIRDYFFIYFDKQIAIIIPKKISGSIELIKKINDKINIVSK